MDILLPMRRSRILDLSTTRIKSRLAGPSFLYTGCRTYNLLFYIGKLFHCDTQIIICFIHLYKISVSLKIYIGLEGFYCKLTFMSWYVHCYHAGIGIVYKSKNRLLRIGRRMSKADNPASNLTQTMSRQRHYTSCICCLLYTSPSPRDLSTSRMPSSA